MTNRRLLFIPEINPHTFLFFYFRGDTGVSYSFRDYSKPNNVITTLAKQYPYTADEILAMAKYDFPAPTHDTNDLDFWHTRILDRNKRFLKESAQPSTSPATNVHAVQPSPSAAESIAVPSSFSPPPSQRPFSHSYDTGGEYPIFGLDRLYRHPVKGGKTQDLNRMLTSPNSEDWMTWNVAQLMHLLGPAGWWHDLVKLAKQSNLDLQEELFLSDQPEVDLWRKVPTPTAYERASRERLAQSINRDWVARSRDPKPVEGNSEIDLVLDSHNFLIFIEAKLGSDISLRTTYDPDRNQIVRNIDCVLEQGRGRPVAFWMLVGDTRPSFTYMQLMRSYQSQPQRLLELLPHRSPVQVEAVIRNLAVVSWQDLASTISTKIDLILSELTRRLATST